MEPETSAPSPPVLLIGMHRSGTSLLVRLLDSLGLFVGWKLAANHEASFFNKHNAWLLAAAGGRWDTPAAIDHLLADGDGVELALAYLEGRLASAAALEFLGPRRYLRYRSLSAVAEPWGWKDPRTTVTLPLWLRLFPGARVLHLVRNGVDVAESLHRRQLAGRELGRHHLERHRRLLGLVAKKGWFGTSPRVANRLDAFRLWEEYLDYGTRFTEGLGERLLELRYETLLRHPQREMDRILAFCRLAPGRQRLADALAGLRRDRAFAFRHDAELTELWQQLRGSSWMRRYGYDSLPVDL